MTEKKKPNAIEEAIGERAKPKTEAEKILQTPTEVAKQILSETPDEPSPSEMLDLEELNRQTEARLQDEPEEELTKEPTSTNLPAEKINQRTTTMSIGTVHPSPPVLKPDHLPVTETSSPASPPQKIKCRTDSNLAEESPKEFESLPELPPQKIDKEFHPVAEPTPGINKLPADFKVKHTYETGIAGAKITPCDCPENDDNSIIHIEIPAEDIELTALRKYIREDGFVLATVAFHIVSLCAQPMTTPSTTSWDFADRAMIPDMVLALLNQPGYLEGIWPSLRIVMGSNKGNAAWTAGIATTIAFFDVIRTLPAIKELNNEEK